MKAGPYLVIHGYTAQLRMQAHLASNASEQSLTSGPVLLCAVRGSILRVHSCASRLDMIQVYSALNPPRHCQALVLAV